MSQFDISEFAESCIGSEYEKSDMISSYFGIDKNLVINMLILKELQELNSFLHYELGGRK